MTEVTQEFIDGFLYNKLIEAAKAMQEIMIALDPSEEELIARVSGIIDAGLSRIKAKKINLRNQR